MNEHYDSDPAYGCGLMILYVWIIAALVAAFLYGYFR